MLTDPLELARMPADLGPDPVADSQRTLLTLLFNKYRGAIFSHLTRIVRSPDDASELMQETYLRVMARAQAAEFESITRAYLFQTATNLARDHLRRQRWRSHESLECVPESAVLSTGRSPEEVTLWRDAVESLSSALQAMPEPTRAVFMRARLDGFSYADIARELHVSVRTVERRMGEAMGLLAKLMEDLL